MVETWIEKKRWIKLKEHLPESHRWKCQYARREKAKDRGHRWDHHRHKERDNGERRRGRREGNKRNTDEGNDS